MVSCTRLFRFDSGHRVLGHRGKCAALHGHGFVAEVECEADKLNDLGMVIDFGVIKAEVGNWIDTHWDHNFLCHPRDELVVLSRSGMLKSVFGGRSPFVMPEALPNPTAENMAQVLLGEARRLLHPHGIRVVRVRLWETVNCHAEVK